MENKNNIVKETETAKVNNTKTVWVVSRDGIRMTKEEWLDMIRSERDI